jgi:alkylhydroperoxidase family enzyme
MPRIHYANEAIAPQELVAAMLARRSGALLNLDRMLLHSPAYARGWNELLGAVRNELALPPRLRELAICAVGSLTRAEYEWRQHAPVFLSAGGSQAQLDRLCDVAAAAEDIDTFDATERAVLRLTLELTRDVTVRDATFTRVQKVLQDQQQIVELVGVIATYNMVSRFLVALDVGPEA